MKENLFSYGTLQQAKVQLESFGRVLNGAKDVLKGYRLASVEITDESVIAKSGTNYHPIAVASENENDSIEGTVFEISVKELQMADDYEVDDYKRVKVQLASGKQAWIYIAAQGT